MPINADGTIDRGARISRNLGEQAHNDALVQGLSEAPSMTDFEHWSVLTIGTGLGNACFTKRQAEC
jgi:hypothetical protein